MDQTDLHVEHDSFIKYVSCVDQNMIQTRLVLTHDLFINELIVLSSQVRLDFVTPMEFS